VGNWFNWVSVGLWFLSTSFIGDAMTKKDKVYMHLKTHRQITSWEAIRLYKVTRLADVIYKFKQNGLEIDTVMVQGSDSRFARYFLR
jgi:hypothetical protein